MNIKPIHTKHDYQRALTRIQEIFDAKPGSKEGDELELLGYLQHHPRGGIHLTMPEDGFKPRVCYEFYQNRYLQFRENRIIQEEPDKVPKINGGGEFHWSRIVRVAQWEREAGTSSSN